MPENELGQPIGAALPGWTKRHASALSGRDCRGRFLPHGEPVDAARHAAQLARARSRSMPRSAVWDLSAGLYGTASDHCRVAGMAGDRGGQRTWIPGGMRLLGTQARAKPMGVAAYLRIDANSGSIEVGGLMYSPYLQRKPASTEAMYLMMRRAFDELGYRRYEWKCDHAERAVAGRRALWGWASPMRRHFPPAYGVSGAAAATPRGFPLLDTEWPKLRGDVRILAEPG